MRLNNKNVAFQVLIVMSFFSSGCELLMLRDWNDTRSLEEYGDKVALTLSTLLPYIGKSKDDVRQSFGEPTSIKSVSGIINTHYKIEKVPFDEIWDYTHMRGIPMINAERGTILFYFNDGIVVSVDAS